MGGGHNSPVHHMVTIPDSEAVDQVKMYFSHYPQGALPLEKLHECNFCKDLAYVHQVIEGEGFESLMVQPVFTPKQMANGLQQLSGVRGNANVKDSVTFDILAAKMCSAVPAIVHCTGCIERVQENKFRSDKRTPNRRGMLDKMHQEEGKKPQLLNLSSDELKDLFLHLPFLHLILDDFTRMQNVRIQLAGMVQGVLHREDLTLVQVCVLYEETRELLFPKSLQQHDLAPTVSGEAGMSTLQPEKLFAGEHQPMPNEDDIMSELAALAIDPDAAAALLSTSTSEMPRDVADTTKYMPDILVAHVQVHANLPYEDTKPTMDLIREDLLLLASEERHIAFPFSLLNGIMTLPTIVWAMYSVAGGPMHMRKYLRFISAVVHKWDHHHFRILSNKPSHEVYELTHSLKLQWFTLIALQAKQNEHVGYTEEVAESMVGLLLTACEVMRRSGVPHLAMLECWTPSPELHQGGGIPEQMKNY